MNSPETAGSNRNPKIEKRPENLYASGTDDFRAEMGNKLVSGVSLTTWEQTRLDLIVQGVLDDRVVTPGDLLGLDIPDGVFNARAAKFVEIAGRDGFKGQDVFRIQDLTAKARALNRYAELRGGFDKLTKEEKKEAKKVLQEIKKTEKANKQSIPRPSAEEQKVPDKKGKGVSVKAKIAVFAAGATIAAVALLSPVWYPKMRDVLDRQPPAPAAGVPDSGSSSPIATPQIPENSQPTGQGEAANAPAEKSASQPQPAEKGSPEKAPAAASTEAGEKTEAKKVKISMPSGLTDEQKNRYTAANDFDWSLIFGLDDYTNFTIGKEGGELEGWKKRDVFMEVFREWLKHKYGVSEGEDWINDLKNGTKTWKEAIPDPKDQEKILKTIEIKSFQDFITSFGDMEWIDWEASTK